MENIWKKFPGVNALKGVDLSVKKGEIHGIVGENGAGKSTLVKILSGIYSANEGRIFLDSREVKFYSARDSQDEGISLISQEILLIPFLNIAENIFLSNMPRRFGQFIDIRKIHQKSREILNQLGMDIDTYTKVGKLSGRGLLQLIQIAKALSINPKILIMDESTASLNEDEKRGLFEIINRLKEKGITIIMISHNIEEIFNICDSVTVLKDGIMVGEESIDKVTLDLIIKMMVGEDLIKYKKVTKADMLERKTALEIRSLSLKNSFSNINLIAFKGEVVGIFGLRGAGKSELLSTIFGLTPAESGEIYIDGERKSIKSPNYAINLGMGFIPEEKRFLV
jgi:ABC-type sugar transport system ATPase subunit